MHEVDGVYLSLITHVAKNVAVPIVVRDGVIKINSEATQAASAQRKSTLRSRALKWSSHAGNFLPLGFAGADPAGDADRVCSVMMCVHEACRERNSR